MGLQPSKGKNNRRSQIGTRLPARDEKLDAHADESNSFVHLRPSQMSKKSYTTFGDDMRKKIEEIARDIGNAVKTKDDQALALQKKKIELLLTDVEMMEIRNEAASQAKNEIERTLCRCYQKILRREKCALSEKNRASENLDGDFAATLGKFNAFEILLDNLDSDLRDDSCDCETIQDGLKSAEAFVQAHSGDRNVKVMKARTILMKKINNVAKILAEKRKTANDAEGKAPLENRKFKFANNSKELSVGKHPRFEKTLEEIANISARIDEFASEIKKFDGTTADLRYNFFASALQQKKRDLELIKCPPDWTQIVAFKMDVLRKISHLKNCLDIKLSRNGFAKNVDKVPLSEKLMKKTYRRWSSEESGRRGIENEINFARDKIQSFAGDKESFDELEEELLNVMIRVEEFHAKQIISLEQKEIYLEYLKELLGMLTTKRYNDVAVSEKSIIV